MRAHNQHSETRRPGDRYRIVTTGPSRFQPAHAPQPTFGQRKQATASVAGGHSAMPERMVSCTETGS